jgi:hypothetical protein
LSDNTDADPLEEMEVPSADDVCLDDAFAAIPTLVSLTLAPPLKEGVEVAVACEVSTTLAVAKLLLVKVTKALTFSEMSPSA